MDSGDRVKVEDAADQTFSSGNVISEINSSGQRDKLCCNGAISTIAHLDHTESISDHRTPKVTESENSNQGLKKSCNVEDSDCVTPNTESSEIEAQAVTLECSQLSGADEDERHHYSFEHNSMNLNEESVDNSVDISHMKLPTSMACGVLTTCVKGKQLSSRRE